MISKLEKPIGCFSDCYQQWKSDHYNRKYDNLMKDSTIDQSAKHLCETIKKISDKLNKVTKSFRYEGNSELDTVSNKIYDYITCLESGIYNYESNFQEEHKFRNDQIEIIIYDKEYKNNDMSFIYPANCRFEDVISDVTNHFKITDPKIQFSDDRGDMITIDSSQVFDKALQFAWENSMKGKLDMIRLDLQIESKSIIPVRCRSCRNEFLITSEYVHSDICQQ